MLKIDFATFISLILSIGILGAFIFWLLQDKIKKGKNSILNDIKYLQQCPYCTHIFSLYKKQTVYQCPQCKSYIGENR